MKLKQTEQGISAVLEIIATQEAGEGLSDDLLADLFVLLGGLLADKKMHEKRAETVAKNREKFNEKRVANG